MRIGRVIVDTDNMNVEELEILIKELNRIKYRKLYADELSHRMKELLDDAKSHGFMFTDKDFGQVLESTDFTIYDMGEEKEVEEEDVD